MDYLRVSTEEQAKGYGIAYTGKRTAKYIERKGWEHVDTYSDEVSGSLEAHQRPDLKRLMKDARSVPRPFDMVVVNEGRGIGRTGRAFWKWVWELEDLGVYVAVVKKDYDNTTAAGRSQMRKDADYAEEERELIRERTQGGVQEKAEEGGHPGGVAPFGWRIQDKGVKGKSRIVLDEEHAVPLLRKAWNYIVEDSLAPHSVEEEFNRQGIAGPTKDYWPRGSLRHVLTGRAVQEAVRVHRDPSSNSGRRGTRLDAEGMPMYGDTVVIDIPPLFTKEELRLLNAALARTACAASSSTAEHPLSGHVVGACGKHYIGASRIGRDLGRAYRCSGKGTGYAGQPRCDCPQINAEVLEGRVWHEVRTMLEDPDRLMAMAADAQAMARAEDVDYTSRIATLEKELTTQDAAITAAALAAAKRADAESAIERAVQALEEEREQIAHLLEETRRWQREAEAVERQGDDLQRLAELARERLVDMTAGEKAEVVDLLELRVAITGDVPRKTRCDDRLSQWFRKRERSVPLLSDDAWSQVAPLFQARKGRRSSDARVTLGAVLHKARVGCAWSDLSSPPGNLSSVWLRWVRTGFWEQLMDVLSGMPGTQIAEYGIALPPLDIRGYVDPLLFQSRDMSPEKDALFKASDYKISPFELESALLEHEAVAEAAVVPAPDAVRLAVPKAYVVLAKGWDPGEATAEAIFEYTRSVLAPYKRLRRIEFTTELPKTISGKIRRVDLRERTAEGSGDEWVERARS
ncbi:recombinase family protein [Streptomyces sp. MZ04]|uniref:recombinase family protein n=1 Tax=Streptomyces sp. MZ04 TaxID=2559236 RepID=UPI00107EC193|nr:recombinase family protein [Streptomyces sp. MZ04]TGA87343.1 DNA recombinase [Streptomyces sp. MZ04]